MSAGSRRCCAAYRPRRRCDRCLAGLLAALELHGCRPVQVGTERWLALCPCCGKLQLVLQRNTATSEPPTAADRDLWFGLWRAAA
jgi:hypothetical protein